ncbi:MAG: nucleotidyltransferase domain-containing protein [Bacteriovoracaceae bacterium]|nr:nucleotidyltransferase domain-containing protein [Bacteriovoracaceae bacterium]
MTLLSEIFTSKSRAKILEKLFDGKLDEYYLRQLERVTELGVVTLKDEVERLNRLDLITKRKSGNRIYYRANDIHPLYSVFRELVDKTSGPRFKLQEVLSKIIDIELAFIFGSYALGTTHAQSDIDLFIIGNISSMKLSAIISDIQDDIGLIEINFHNYKKATLKKAIKEKQHFVLSMKKTEKIMLKGSSDEFESIFG